MVSLPVFAQNGCDWNWSSGTLSCPIDFGSACQWLCGDDSSGDDDGSNDPIELCEYPGMPSSIQARTVNKNGSISAFGSNEACYVIRGCSDKAPGNRIDQAALIFKSLYHWHKARSFGWFGASHRIWLDNHKHGDTFTHTWPDRSVGKYLISAPQLSVPFLVETSCL